MTSTTPPTTLIRDLYARMLLTRIVDDYAQKLALQGCIDFVASCRGHEAAQVGSSFCIEVGNDFTLPYYRDLGVVLTIGMTPYEVFRTYLQTRPNVQPIRTTLDDNTQMPSSRQHWDYHKHNTVTASAPVATQLLHAAGIAFACKLRQTAVVTVAYCGDGATAEPDFLEAMRFTAQHQLPIVFICEQNCSASPTMLSLPPSCTQGLALPATLNHQRIDGRDIVDVYTAMRSAMQDAREGHGPTLLEMYVTRLKPDLPTHEVAHESTAAYQHQEALKHHDPLMRCQYYLQQQGAWNDEWATQLSTRISTEVERALQDALRETH